jgi:hypothetical protein
MFKVWCRGLLSIPVGMLGLMLCFGKTANAESIEQATQLASADQSVTTVQAIEPVQAEQYVAQVNQEFNPEANPTVANLDYLAGYFCFSAN